MVHGAPSIPPPLPSRVGETGSPDSWWTDYAVPWAFAAFLVVGLVTGILLAVRANGPDSGALFSSPTLTIAFSFIPQHVAAIAVLLFICFLFVPPGQRLAALRLVRPRRPLSVQTFLKYWLGLYTAAAILNIGTTQLFKAAGLPVAKPILQYLAPSGRLDISGWLMFTLCAVFLAPVTEEILFRLALFETLRRVTLVPTLLTAAIFAAFHLRPNEFPGLFVIGFGLQNLRQRTHSLVPSILLHTAINATGVLLMAVAAHYGVLHD